MSAITTEYDAKIKTAAQQWLPEWDWLWLKAQAYQESLLQPDAESPSGAKGLFQLLDPTFGDCAERLKFPLTANILDPNYNIQAGVYYCALMVHGWGAKRSDDDRRKLGLASYNAGFGNILEAQKLTATPNSLAAMDYDTIIAKLPEVTGQLNAHQTTTYVSKIYQWYAAFKKEESNGA